MLKQKLFDDLKSIFQTNVGDSFASLIDYLSKKEAFIEKLKKFRNVVGTLIKNKKYDYILKLEGEAKAKVVELLKSRGIEFDGSKDLYIDFRDLLLIRSLFLEPILLTIENKEAIKQPLTQLKVRPEVLKIVNNDQSNLDKLRSIAALKGSTGKFEMSDVLSDDSLNFKIGKYLIDVMGLVVSTLDELTNYEKLYTNEKAIRKDNKITLTTSVSTKYPLASYSVDRKIFEGLDDQVISEIIKSIKIEGLSLSKDTKWIDVIRFLNDIISTKKRLKIEFYGPVSYEKSIYNVSLKLTIDFSKLYTQNFDLKNNNINVDVSEFGECDALFIIQAMEEMINDVETGFGELVLLLLLNDYVEFCKISPNSFELNLNIGNDAFTVNLLVSKQ